MHEWYLTNLLSNYLEKSSKVCAEAASDKTISQSAIVPYKPMPFESLLKGI